MRLDNLVDFLSFNVHNVDIIGSFANKQIKYPSDIDLHETIIWKHKSKRGILDTFQAIFENAIDNQVYITDFKCGYVNGKAIRWNYNDIMKGYIDLNISTRIKFLDMFDHKSTIKLDTICLLKGKYVEITINYFFQFANGTSTILTDYVSLNKTFYSDYVQLLSEKNYIKAIKRLYKYFLVIEDKKYELLCRHFLNSKAGELNYYFNNLKNIQEILKLYPKDVNISIVKTNVFLNVKEIFDNNQQKYKLLVDDFSTIDEIYSFINNIINVISPIINQLSLNFIRSNKLKSKHIINTLYL